MTLSELAAEWLWRWPNHTIVSRDPNRGFIDTRQVEAIERAVEYIEAHNGTRNLYFMPNGDRREGVDVCEKADKEEISECYAVFADIDTYKTGMSNDTAIEMLTERLPSGIPGPCSAVNLSGGGVQGFWLLDAPWPCNGDLERVYEYENRLLGIIDAYGPAADKVVHDVCRIMRLPHTINVPDLNKRKTGRKPALAEPVLWEPDRRYSLADFPSVTGKFPLSRAVMSANERLVAGMLAHPLTVESLDKLNIGPAYRALLEQPEHHNETEHAVIMHLLRRGVPANVVLGVVTDTRWSLGQYEHAKEQTHPGNAIRQVVRALCRILHDNGIDLEALKSCEHT